MLHPDIFGKGPPLVLLHGWAFNRRVFGSLARRLARRFHLHRVDLPGHGASSHREPHHRSGQGPPGAGGGARRRGVDRLVPGRTGGAGPLSNTTINGAAHAPFNSHADEFFDVLEPLLLRATGLPA